MSTMLTLIQTATGLAVLGAAAIFFRPLLVGIGRAAVLAVRPRPPKARLAKRT